MRCPRCYHHPPMALTVFIISSSDLADERRAAADTVDDLGLRADTYETWPALAQAPEPASIAAAAKADIVILLIGARYGTAASTGRSIIHEEYRAATANDIPVLAFRIDDGDPEQRQLDFIAEVKKNQTIRPVVSADGLRKEIRKALMAETSRRWSAAPAVSAPPAEVRLPAERRMAITIDLQAEEIGHLRDALTKNAAAKLNESRELFRSGRVSDAIAALEALRSGSEWSRIDAPVQARILTTLATFRLATGTATEDVEPLVDAARAADAAGDFSYVDVLILYERDGAAAALESLDAVHATNTWNVKIALLLDAGRLEEAAELLRVPPPSVEPDSETERLRAFLVLEEGDAEMAVQIIGAALNAQPSSESLRLASAIISVASTIPADERQSRVTRIPAPVDPAMVVATPEMLSRLESAGTTLNDVIAITQRTGEMLQQIEAWHLAALALHPSRQDAARSFAATLLTADPSDPAALIWSIAYRFPIDVERAVEALTSSKEISEDPQRILAVVAALAGSGQITRANELLEQHRTAFHDEGDLWRFWRVRLLTEDNRVDVATEFVTTIETPELRHTAEMMIAERRANDTGEWDEYLDLAGRSDAGYTSLAARARLGRWKDIVDTAVDLTERLATPATVKLAATALSRVGQHQHALQLLDRHSAIWSASVVARDLRRLAIHSQIVTGELTNALRGASELFGDTKSGRDLLLTIRAAIATGNQKDAPSGRRGFSRSNKRKYALKTFCRSAV